MTKRRSNLLACFAVAGLMVGLPVLANADDAGDPSEQIAEPAGAQADGQRQPANIEEIVVTARKRAESLQQTPVAISAFTETDLEDRDIRQIQEITASVPTLQFDNAVGNQSSARIYLRGVGNGDPISSDDPGVGIYVDGVFLPRAQGALLTVSDIQQVEVLRGPQGTLFGKNTIGGAVSITTRKPDLSEFSSRGSVRIGNYHRFDTRLAVNVPLVPERAAMRFSLATGTRDGFSKNKASGRDFSDDKLLAGRVQFLMAPTDNLELNFSLDRSRENRAPIAGKCKVSNTLRAPGPGQNPGLNGVGELTPGSLNGFANPNIALLEASLRATGGTLDTNGDGFLSFAEADINRNGLIDSAASAKAFASVVEIPVGPGPGGAVPQLLRLGGGGPASQSNLLNACARDDARDTYSVAADLSSLANNLDTYGSNFTLTYDFEDATFKSISSWRRNENETRIDNDYTELNFAQSSRDAGSDIQDAFSQEFQLTGRSFDGRLNWVVGAYAFAEDIRGEAFGGLSTTSEFAVGQNLGFAANPGDPTDPIRVVVPTTGMRPDPNNPDQMIAFDTFALDPTATEANIAAALAALNAADPNANIRLDPACIGIVGVNCLIVPGAVTNSILRVKNQGYAGYTQGTFDLTDQLSVTLGVRLTSERKRVRSRVMAATSGFVGGDLRRAGEIDFEFERSERFKDVSPLANISYQLNDDTLLYTTFSKGFKSGGFNGRANDPALTGGIDDEKLTSYEIGFKTSMFDRRIVLNAAAYWSIYEDIQLTIPQGLNGQASIAVLNAGEADIKGGEVEVRARLLPNLELTGSLGVVNSKYTEFDDGTNLQADDRPVLATPNYTGNVAALYGIPLGSMGDLRARVEWTHRGESSTDVVGSRILRKGKNGELDATLTFAMADGVTELVLFGNNLLNREYFTNGVNLNGSLGIAYRFFNNPRTYGLEVRRQF